MTSIEIEKELINYLDDDFNYIFSTAFLSENHITVSEVFLSDGTQLRFRVSSPLKVNSKNRIVLYQIIESDNFKIGSIVRGENWAWGAEIIAIGDESVALQTGNRETGEIIAVKKSDITEIKNLLTGKFEQIGNQQEKKI